MFQKLRDQAEALFCSLPPPIPTVIRHNIPPSSRPSANSGGHRKKSAPPRGIPAPAAMAMPEPPAFSMAIFSNRNNICFDESCLVKMANGKTQKISSLQSGDLLCCGDGKPRRLKCLVENILPHGIVSFVSLPCGLVITPWHPIFWNNNWVFPQDIAKPQIYKRRAVYNLLLECTSDGSTEKHSVFVNGIQCVTLGHGMNLNSVTCHPFFGVWSAVVGDLSKMVGWNSGKVQVTGVLRSEDLISSLVEC